MTDRDYLWCALNLALDREEELAQMYVPPVPERGGGGALPGMRARHGCNWVEPEL